MERFKLSTCLLSDEDLKVLMESLWHSVQRGDIPDEDRERAHKLREQFKERFHAKDDHEESEVNDGQRIQDAGGFINIGPECFGLCDGSVLSWRGENYVPQKPTLRVRIHNAWVRLMNRRR